MKLFFPTDKQIEYVKTLARKTKIELPKISKQVLKKSVSEEDLKNLSAPEVSKLIEAYKRLAG